MLREEVLTGQSHLSLACSGVIVRGQSGWQLADPADLLQGTAATLLLWWQEMMIRNAGREVSASIYLEDGIHLGGLRVETVWATVYNRWTTEQAPGWRRLLTLRERIGLLRMVVREQVAGAGGKVRIQVYDPQYVSPTTLFPKRRRARRQR